TVMAALLQPVISNDGSVLARCAAILWDHALLSANIAARQAQGASRDDLHATQLLALLYGLGSVVVVQVLRDSWGKSGAGSPAADTLVSLLDAWSMHCARAISADWGLSERVQRALDEPGGGSEGEGPGDLGPSPRISRAQAADEMAGVPEPGGCSEPGWGRGCVLQRAIRPRPDAGTGDASANLSAPFPSDPATMSTPDNARLDRIVAEARRSTEQRAKGYRERALKMYPWTCGRCARDFTRANLQEL